MTPDRGDSIKMAFVGIERLAGVLLHRCNQQRVAKVETVGRSVQAQCLEYDAPVPHLKMGEPHQRLDRSAQFDSPFVFDDEGEFVSGGETEPLANLGGKRYLPLACHGGNDLLHCGTS